MVYLPKLVSIRKERISDKLEVLVARDSNGSYPVPRFNDEINAYFGNTYHYQGRPSWEHKFDIIHFNYGYYIGDTYRMFIETDLI